MNISISKKQIITNIVLLFSASSIAQVATALSILFTTRPLGIEAFGQYSACFALTKMTSIVFNLGMDTWLLREGRRGETPLGRLVASNLIIKTALGLVWLVGLFITLQFLDPKTYPPQLLYLSALATWMEAALNTVTYSFNIALKNQATATLTVLSSLSLLISTIGLVFMQQADPTIYALVRLFIACLAALGGLFWLLKIQPLSFDRTTVRITLTHILPFALSDLLLLIYTQADITIVAVMLGKHATGIYSPASSILRAMFVIPSAVYLVMTPVISQLVTENSQRLSRVIRQTNLSLAGIGAILWISVGFLGPGIVNLVSGSEFSASGEVLAILGAILFVKSCSYASATIIIATGKQGQRVVVQGIAAVVNVLLNLLIINQYGVIGVARVYVASDVLLLAGYMIIAEGGRVKAMRKGKIIPSIEKT